MKKISSQPNLFSRLVKVLLLLTFTTVTLFMCATLFITYAFEDAFFSEKLKRAQIQLAEGEPLPHDLQLLDSTVDIEPEILQRIRFLETSEKMGDGEFSYQGRHYHYLDTEYGTILYDVTDVTIVDRALEDIFLILATLLVPILLLTYWVAHYCAKYALKPFSTLCKVFTESDENTSVNTEFVERIQEVDVKALAYKLNDALNKKANILERQLLLNQGIAHELRTPLQVMEHSIELLSYSHPALSDSTSYVRLQKSVHRMTRLSNGMLWLTSEKVCHNHLSVGSCIHKLLDGELDMTSAHNVKVELNIIDEPKVLMPEEVLELIVFNLLNNLVQHGLSNKGKKLWKIKVEKQKISFSNFVDPLSGEKVNEANFGIGLTLVTKLAERFGLSTHYKIDNNEFLATLST